MDDINKARKALGKLYNAAKGQIDNVEALDALQQVARALDLAATEVINSKVYTCVLDEIRHLLDLSLATKYADLPRYVRELVKNREVIKALATGSLHMIERAYAEWSPEQQGEG